jgi:SAM-dependent methyltransferase
MNYFDCKWDGELVNEGTWFHNMPLPDGRRMAGANHDRNREQKLWKAFDIDVKGKDVLDIGANDGFFSIGAKLAGAEHVTAVNPADTAMNLFPNNLLHIQEAWKVDLEIVVDTFLGIRNRKYDVIFFFGVLYHSEDVLGAFRKMKSLLKEGGKILIETPLTRIQTDKPILEVASDIRHTTVGQGKQYINRAIGLGSFFIPNYMAMQELTWMIDLQIEQLPDSNVYTNSLKDRKLFVIK